MKKILLSFYLLICTASVVLAEVGYTTNPRPNLIVKGEPVEFILTNTDGEAPVIDKFPKVDGIEWDSRRPGSSVNIINSNIRKSNIYTFKATKTGEIVIPEITVNVDNRAMAIKNLKLMVRERTYRISGSNGYPVDRALEDLVFEKVIIPSEKKVYYVGEEIPMQVKLYVSLAFRIRCGDPQIDMEKIVLKDYSSVNRKNRNFAQEEPDTTIETIDGIDYRVYIYKTSFRPVSSGKLTGKVTTETIVQTRNYFHGVRRNLSADVPPIKVLALPEPPGNTEFLGLVGNWHVKISLKEDKVKIGDTATLNLLIKGVGSLETLNVPKLDIPGFRVYPPEVDKKYNPHFDRSTANINYVMIATAQGKAPVDVSFAFFDSLKGKYREFQFKKNITVEKSDKFTSTENVFVGNEQDTYVPKKRREKPSSSGILYLKRKPYGRVELPLLDNHMVAYWVLFILGPLMIVVSILLNRRRMKLDKSPHLRRRREAVAARGKILAKLRKADEDSIDQVIQQDVVPFVNDMMALPPGTSASELADRVSDSEMGECLKSSGESSYMPGAVSMDKSELKKRVINAVKRFSVILLLCGLSLNSFAAEIVKKADNVPVKSENEQITDAVEALNAYDRGDFGQAAEYYAGLIDPHAPDPALLFNLGNCLCRQKRYARAMVCYERALRLKPGDSDILENLNYVRRKLFLPEVGAVSNPVELLMDRVNFIRPDQWLLVAAVCWFLLCLAYVIRRRIDGFKRVITGVLLVGIIGSLAAVVTQYRTVYSSKVAVITGHHVKVYSLPSEKSGRVEFKLRNGETVNIEEQRATWIRVRAENGEGWILSKTASPVWGNFDTRSFKQLCGIENEDKTIISKTK